MVVWRFWQQSCCHSIPSAATARNSCCVMWPSLPLHASFLIFWPGRLNLRPTGHDSRSLCSLSRILHHLLDKAPALCVAWHCLTAHPSAHISHSRLYNMGCTYPSHLLFPKLWVMFRDSEVNKVMCCVKKLQHFANIVGFIPWSCVYFIFLKICCFSELSRVLLSKHLGVQQMCLFQEEETWRVLSSRSVIIDLETARFASL